MEGLSVGEVEGEALALVLGQGVVERLGEGVGEVLGQGVREGLPLALPLRLPTAALPLAPWLLLTHCDTLRELVGVVLELRGAAVGGGGAGAA